MNKKANDLIIPFIAFTILVIVFAVLIITGFEKTNTKQCIFPAEVDCISYQAKNSTTETLTIQLKNNLGENLNITKVEVQNSKCTYGLLSTTNGTTMWPKEDILWLRLNCKELNTEQGYAVVSIELRTEIENTPLRFIGKAKYYE